MTAKDTPPLERGQENHTPAESMVRQDLSRESWAAMSNWTQPTDRPFISQIDSMMRGSDGQYSAFNRGLGQQPLKMSDFTQAPLLAENGRQILPGVTIVGDGPLSKPTGGRVPAASGGTGTEAGIQGKEDLKAKVMDNSLSSTERLAAVKQLVEQGTTSIKTIDNQGREGSLRLEVEKLGNREMVHLFARQGRHEAVALRGIAGGETIERQKNERGQSVSLEGRGIHQLKNMRLQPEGSSAEAPAPKQRVEPQVQPQKLEAQPQPQPQKLEAQPQPKKLEAQPQPLPQKLEAQPQPQKLEAQPQPQKLEAQPQPQKLEAQPQPQKLEAQPQPKKLEAQPKPQKLEQPVEKGDRPQNSRVVRSAQELSKFYRHQDDGLSCSAFSMGMMASDHLYGRPLNYGKETQAFKELAGVTRTGYRGDLNSIATKLEKVGLHAKAFEYAGGVGAGAMQDLNRELDQGKSAVARVRNPHTGNNHYIYVAGRDEKGNYIIGDPDRANRSHFSPVSPRHLQSMMSYRDGFVVGWAPTNGQSPTLASESRRRR